MEKERIGGLIITFLRNEDRARAPNWIKKPPKKELGATKTVQAVNYQRCDAMWGSGCPEYLYSLMFLTKVTIGWSPVSAPSVAGSGSSTAPP